MSASKLDPKVAQYVKESREVIEDLQKTAADKETEIDGLKKEAADHQESAQKLAKATADDLLSKGVISQEHHAKFASDLADPTKAHNLLRSLGSKLAQHEADAVPPTMGGGTDLTKKAADEETQSADDRFNQRVREASGK